ncbi:hypothetical protein [Staphylococcus equorum]|uniref:hypothetical protein n=1 Tax=Staphylococcus equorum TaxID=246432 RepID=UPI003F57A9C8
MDFKLLYYVINMVSFDTFLDILSMLATFGGALVGALIAGLFTLAAIKIDKKAQRKREEKQIKTRLLFEVDNLIAFNHTIADNLFIKNESERIGFLKNFVLYDKKNRINLTLLEMEKFRYLLLHDCLNHRDDENKIYEKFKEKGNSKQSISLSSEKLHKVKFFLSNTEKNGKLCIHIDRNSILRLKEFNSNLQDLSHLIYVLSSEELNVLYGIKQTIKIIIENTQETSSDYIYEIDRYYFVHNILINQLNIMCKNIL